MARTSNRKRWSTTRAFPRSIMYYRNNIFQWPYDDIEYIYPKSALRDDPISVYCGTSKLLHRKSTSNPTLTHPFCCEEDYTKSVMIKYASQRNKWKSWYVKNALLSIPIHSILKMNYYHILKIIDGSQYLCGKGAINCTLNSSNHHWLLFIGHLSRLDSMRFAITLWWRS